MVDCFNDPQSKYIYSIHVRERIPKFFFINVSLKRIIPIIEIIAVYFTLQHFINGSDSFDLEIIDNVNPFCYSVRKSHLYFCYNTYPGKVNSNAKHCSLIAITIYFLLVSWLMEKLCSLYRLYNENYDFCKMLTDISENIESWSSNKRRGLNSADFTHLCSYDSLLFKQLLFKYSTNTLDQLQTTQETVSTFEKNDNLIYDMKPDNDIIGKCLILNYKSMNTLTAQSASDRDVELLKDIFTELKFKVEIENDLTANATETILTESMICSLYLISFILFLFVVSEFDHSSMSCFALFIIAECYSNVLHGIARDGMKIISFFVNAIIIVL